MFFKRKKENNSNEPVLAASIMPVFSGMYQDILKENNIPFLCRQQGAGGYLKIVTGGLLIADDIYVNAKDYEKARELYCAFIEPELEEN